ncbi:MAG: GNAT family N-acetyltransferase [Xanthomonadaceae bacterium]|jgi:hypothetical protein|nr:GNAT family N-acetyltransferase [Xanthomonadaceae bacterium]
MSFDTQRHLLNQLEPAALVGQFGLHPPEGFAFVQVGPGLPAFDADFGLLTTAEPAFRKRVESWPLHRFWQRWLRLRTRFVGSTVSEYAWLPGEGSLSALAAQLRRESASRTLLIVKDIPQQSPLLDDVDNRRSAEFLRACADQGFILVEGQALAWLPIDFASIDEYLSRFSRSRRRDIRRKLRSRADLEVEVLETGEAFAEPGRAEDFYALYLSVYAQSEIHFDLLSLEFFRGILRDAGSGGRVFVYRAQGRMIGWNLCYIHGDKLVDKFIGLEYPAARDHNLYAVSWIENLEYARRHGLGHYVAGWTDPEVKAQLGARFTFTRHAVYPRNGLLRWMLRRISRYFESDRSWRETHRDGADAAA